MSRAQLERGLLEFVRALRPDTDPPLAVDPGTALFEDGVIDSLRILDLIAFVEERTGSKIPDSAVRLENFRSVRAIVDAFGGHASGTGGAPEPIEPIRIFTRPSGRTGFTRPVESLIARHELELVMPGGVRFRGRARQLLEFFDATAQGWAAEAGGGEETAPACLPREVLARASCPAGLSAFGEALVPPAVCYHVYHAREGTRLDATPLVVSLRGRCLRDEASLDLAGGRLREFEMREIVVLGSRDEVEQFRRRMIERVGDLMTALALEGRIETASDPFFLAGVDPETRARRLMQQVLPLKLELRLPLDELGPHCAVASFNHHLDFFGRRFSIRHASGATLHTGCVAFGMERWTLAFLAQHGTDEGAWPTPVREFLSSEVEA